MHRQIILSAFSFFLIIAAVQAFQVSTISDITLCQGQSTVAGFSVANDAAIRAFTVSSDSPWLAVVPPGFVLEPGRTQLANSYIRPGARASPGKYQVTITVESGGEARQVQFFVNVVRCPNIGVDFDAWSYSNCPLVGTIYYFNVSNTGFFADEYFFSASAPGFISPARAVLLPGQSAVVRLNVSSPVEPGSYEYQFIVETSKLKAATPVYLAVRESCYAYDLMLGEITEGPQDYLCINESYIIPVKLANMGEQPNAYNLSLDAPAWASLNQTRVELGWNSSAELSILLSNASIGDYRIGLTAVSEHGLQAREAALDTNFTDCQPPAPEPARCFAWLLIVLFVVVLVVVLVLLVARPGIWILWLIAAIILYLLFKAVFGWHFIWELSIFNLALANWLAVAILIVLIIVLGFLLRRGGDGILWPAVLVVGIGMLFLLIALCIFTEVCPGIGTGANETALQPNQLVLYKNSVKRLDLSKLAEDPEGDALSFSATPVANISVVIEGSTAIIAPEKDWHGDSVVNFIADDNRGGRAFSPDIYIVVLDEEGFPSWDWLVRSIQNYIIYVLLVLAVLVVVIVLLMLRREGNKRLVVRRA